ncbi:MAG: hypothetical protein AAGU05_08205, partial [Anaerolineaceae bacterium]
AFVGFNGIGLNLSGVNLAIALWSEVVTTGTPRSWTSVMATVASAAFVGVPGLTMALTSAGIVINKAASDGTVIDYVAGDGETEATDLTASVGPTETVTFEIDDIYGDYARVTGSAEINLFDLVTVTGSFGVEKKTNQTAYISGAAAANVEVTANLLTIGLANVFAFVGFNGVGLQLEDVDLAIALWSEVVTTGTARKWTSVMASVGSASFAGVEGLTMALTSAAIVINKAATDGSVVDYVRGDGETAATELSVAAGPEDTVTFAIDDLNGDSMKVTGNANINLFDLLEVTASFGVEKKTGQTIYVSGSGAENVSVEANLLTIGLANVSAFVGFNGIGLDLADVDLAIALWSEVVTVGTPRKWTSVMASVGSASFVGVEGLTLMLTSAGILINKKAADNTVVDYVKDADESAATELVVTVGPSETVTFAMNDTFGDFMRLTGSATINLFDLVEVTASFGVEKKTNQTIYVSGSSAENTEIQANLLTIGMSDVSVFAGFNGIGLQLDGVDLAIALWSEIVTMGTPRKWTSVMATVGSASFVGIEGLTMALTSAGILINKKAADGTVVD